MFKALKDGDTKLDDKLPIFTNPNFHNSSGMLSWDKEYALRGTCLDDLEVVYLEPEDRKEMTLERLSEYLSTTIGDGYSWPDLSQDQLNDAHEVLHDILSLKFPSDCDGDMPLRVAIINRSVERAVFPMTIPHKGDYKNPLESGGKLDMLLTGVNGLTEEINTTVRGYHLEMRNDEKKNKKREANVKQR